MNRQTGQSCGGMTLLELLAATVILSAVAAAGTTILRDAATAREQAELVHAAGEAIQRWQYERLGALTGSGPSDQEPPEWNWTDEKRCSWRIRAESNTTAEAARTQPRPSAESESPAFHLRSERYIVEVRITSDVNYRACTTFIVPLPEPAKQPPGGHT